MSERIRHYGSLADVDHVFCDAPDCWCQPAAARQANQPQGKAQPDSDKLPLLVEFVGFISVEYRWPQERMENCVKLARLFLSRSATPPQGEAEKEGRT